MRTTPIAAIGLSAFVAMTTLTVGGAAAPVEAGLTIRSLENFENGNNDVTTSTLENREEEGYDPDSQSALQNLQYFSLDGRSEEEEAKGHKHKQPGNNMELPHHTTDHMADVRLWAPPAPAGADEEEGKGHNKKHSGPEASELDERRVSPKTNSHHKGGHNAPELDEEFKVGGKKHKGGKKHGPEIEEDEPEMDEEFKSHPKKGAVGHGPEPDEELKASPKKHNGGHSQAPEPQQDLKKGAHKKGGKTSLPEDVDEEDEAEETNMFSKRAFVSQKDYWVHIYGDFVSDTKEGVYSACEAVMIPRSQCRPRKLTPELMAKLVHDA